MSSDNYAARPAYTSEASGHGDTGDTGGHGEAGGNDAPLSAVLLISRHCNKSALYRVPLRTLRHGGVNRSFLRYGAHGQLAKGSLWSPALAPYQGFAAN